MVPAHAGTYYGQAMTAGNIYSVAGTGHHQGFSGDGGLAAKAEIFSPQGLSVDGAGNLVFSDAGNSRVRVVAAHTGTYYGQAMTAGHIYTVAGNGTQGYSGDGGLATQAELAGVEGLSLDGAGNLLLTDSNAGRIRVVAAHTGTYYGTARP